MLTFAAFSGLPRSNKIRIVLGSPAPAILLARCPGVYRPRLPEWVDAVEKGLVMIGEL